MADDHVLKQLCDSVKFPTEIQVPQVKALTTTFSGPFREKLYEIFKDGSTNVNQLTWRELEIGNMTGNELLRAMVKISRTREWISMSNCVLMTVAGNKVAALCRVKIKNSLVYGTLDSAIAEEKFYFKLFNETFCSDQKNKENAEYYKENEIKEMRAEVPRQFQEFMVKPIEEFDNSLYRRAFIGLIGEVAKVETVDAAERKFLSSIPVAACIYLAVHNDMCGDLQDMFGQSKLLPFDKWESEYRTSHPYYTRKELLLSYYPKKNKLRREAATSIVTRSGIDENNVHDAIERIRRFYEVNEE